MTSVIVQPEALRQLAEQLESQVGPLLEQAAQKFEAAEVEGEAFSKDGLGIALIYPGTREFAMKDVESKIDLLAEMREKLDDTADEWEKAEQASTISAPGGVEV